jgi:peptidoglycan/LPS O-acetylase OafA/YrhL
MSKSSIALHNLRGLTIILVVAFHSAMAYLAYNPAPQPRYDPPPLFSDSHQWIGFDLFCALLYVFMMQLMFLLSGLFVRSSLLRRGAGNFLYNRFLRLGVPFVIGVYLLMPVAQYPVYALGTSAPSWADFWVQWNALPFWRSGQLWFLWCLLALDALAAGVTWAAPRLPEHLGRLSATGKEEPLRYFGVLLAISALAYVPISLIYRPWEWLHVGPFAIQKSYALLYVVYFFAGMGVGVAGLETGPFSVNGKIASLWRAWLAIAFGGFVAWIGCNAIVLQTQPASSPFLELIGSVAFVVTSTAACLALPALFLRFATRPSRLLRPLGDHAFGIYFFHYLFVLWAQYALLELPLLAIVKFTIVLIASLVLSWGCSAAFSRALFVSGLLRAPKMRHTETMQRAHSGRKMETLQASYSTRDMVSFESRAEQ